MNRSGRKNIVVLLGAGASASAGYPLMSDISIYHEIRDLPNESRAIPELGLGTTEALEPLIVDIEHYLMRARGQVTLEAVTDRAMRYSQIVEEIRRDDALYNIFLSNQEIRNEAGPLRRRARVLYELLHKVLLRIYGTDHVKLKEHKKAIYDLLNLLNAFRLQNHPQRLLIYTTNYDTLWERIHEIGRSFRCADLATYPESEPPAVPFWLCRLHGCVRYWRMNGRTSFVEDHDIDTTRLEFDVWPNADRSPGEMGKGRLSELMTIKVGEREPDLEHEPFRAAFERLERDLNKRNTVCVVIGFSFRDVNASHLIFDAMYRERLDRLICIDPFISRRDITDRLCRAGGHPARLNRRRQSDLERRIWIENHCVSDADMGMILRACQ